MNPHGVVTEQEEVQKERHRQGIKSNTCFNATLNKEHLNELRVLLGSHKALPNSD